MTRRSMGTAQPGRSDRREERSCRDPHHCVTCADEGVELRVLEVREDRSARCEGDVEVLVDLIAPPVEPGETVLVHAGVALARVAP